MCKQWKIKGNVEIAAMSKDFFSFAFLNKEDLENVLFRCPWAIGRSTLALKKWTPNMEMNDFILTAAPIWIGLPLEFWNEDIFKGIASSFGELLSINALTRAKSRLLYA